MTNIILDIDGTIWDTTGVVSKAWNQAVKDRGIEGIVITPDILKKEFGKIMTVIADDLFVGISEEEKAKLLELCCIYEHKAVDENQKDLTFEGVREGIKRLAKTCNVYIVSNCQDGYIEQVIEKNQLGEYIRDTECFGRTGLSKGANIRILMERNHLEDAVYVGDTMGDYEASREAGVRFIFASYGFGSVEKPDDIIEKFDDLVQMFA